MIKYPLLSVIFFQRDSGERPVREFLVALKQSDREIWKVVMAAVRDMKRHDLRRPPLTKKIEKDLYELRPNDGQSDIRLFWTYGRVSGVPVLVLLYPFKKKRMDIAKQDLQMGRKYLKEHKNQQKGGRQ